MTAALRAELLKARATPVMLAIAAGALALAGAHMAGLYPKAGVVAPRQYLGFLTEAHHGDVFALVAGIVLMAGERRHSTLGVTLLAVPGRDRLLLAKAIVAAAVGAVMGAVVAAVAVALLILPFGMPPGGTVAQIVEPLTGVVVDFALFAVIGVGVAALLQDQFVAVGFGLAWLLAVEPLAALVCGWAAPFLPGGAAAVVAGDSWDPRLARCPAAVGFAVLLAYALACCLVGCHRLRRADAG